MRKYTKILRSKGELKKKKLLEFFSEQVFDTTLNACFRRTFLFESKLFAMPLVFANNFLIKITKILVLSEQFNLDCVFILHELRRRQKEYILLRFG